MQDASRPLTLGLAEPNPSDTTPLPSRERSLDRVVQMLDYLHHNQHPIAIGELAKRLNAPRSTTYNLIRTLTAAGLLETAGEDGKVFFGKKLYLYGMDYMRENELVRRGREEVDSLSRTTGETAELCMLQNGRYTIIHMCAGARPFRISSAIGLQIPLPWTASGRLLLSDLDRAGVEALVSPDDLVLPSGQRIDFEAFLKAIADARELGSCVTSGLVDAFTKCIAAPVFGGAGTVEATLCLVVPVDMTGVRTEELTALLLDRARKLSLR